MPSERPKSKAVRLLGDAPKGWLRHGIEPQRKSGIFTSANRTYAGRRLVEERSARPFRCLHQANAESDRVASVAERAINWNPFHEKRMQFSVACEIFPFLVNRWISTIRGARDQMR